MNEERKDKEEEKEKGEKEDHIHAISFSFDIRGAQKKFRICGPTSNGNPPITEDILWSLEKFFFNFYIGNNINPPITDKNGWSLEIRE